MKKKPTHPIAVVVEGKADAAILRSLLTGDSTNQTAHFFAAQGKLSLASLGRNILVHEGVPVMVVADADAGRAESVRSQQLSALESIAPSARFGAFVFSPDLETVVVDAVERPGASPNGNAQYSSDQLAELLRSLPPAKLTLLRNHPQVKSFLDSVKRLQDA